MQRPSAGVLTRRRPLRLRVGTIAKITLPADSMNWSMFNSASLTKAQFDSISMPVSIGRYGAHGRVVVAPVVYRCILITTAWPRPRVPSPVADVGLVRHHNVAHD